MIVVTSLCDTPRCVMPGDTFNLSIQDRLGSEVIVRETITVSKTIDFIASFRFALEDGTCPGFYLMGVFACKSELPVELQEAVMFDDLTQKQKDNFVKSVGIEIEDKKKKHFNFFGYFRRRI